MGAVVVELTAVNRNAHEDRKTNEHGRRDGNRLRLLDTCRTGQDVFILGLRQFGHLKLAEKAEKEVSART